MQAALAPRGDARAFLTHFVGSGLDDDCYFIQRYLFQANGDIVPVDAEGVKPKGRRRPRPTVALLKQVESLRPARDGDFRRAPTPASGDPASAYPGGRPP